MQYMAAPGTPPQGKAEFATLKRFLPYLWPPGEPALRARVVIAMLLVLLAKSTSLVMPFAFKGAIDRMAAGVPDGIQIAVALVARLCAGAFRRRVVRQSAQRHLRKGRPDGGAAAVAGCLCAISTGSACVFTSNAAPAR